MNVVSEYYDSGLLNDFGGGNVDWWWDYIRAEVGRCNDHWSAQLEQLRQSRLPDEVVDIKVVIELRAENERLRQRMQIMREEVTENYWKWFCIRHPEAAEWFDEEGIPR